jgi:phosphoribosylaminoimidazolecarboxamide formyltransferase / IMP cyclohydrolase
MKRALISVYDKTGIVEFAKELVKRDFEIISTSGTAKLLEDNKIKIKTIEELTKSPEVLGGRVKTLHPFVFAGILADRFNPDHKKQVDEFGFLLFDLVVVSLYPFRETIKKEDCTIPEAIEQIDIGGVSLIRAAAKNYTNVSVLVKPSQYNEYVKSLDDGENININLASEAFSCITEYDSEIADYFRKISGSQSGVFSFYYKSSHELRYGENPHQKASIFNVGEKSFEDIFEKLHGKELSYINILDIDAAYNLISEFDEPACAILKHTNPSGAACDNNLTNAYLKALACDNVSRFGGIIILNRKLDIAAAQEIDKIKTDIVIVPEYDNDTLEFLMKKKNRVLIKFSKFKLPGVKDLKSVAGGVLVQNRDEIIIKENELKVVTRRSPSDDELRDLIFAMKVCKHTKSNSVVYAKNLQTVGIGGGQPSRIDSSMLAVQKAKRFGMDLNGCSVASDAFFPFPDGVIEAAKAGAKSVIQPGGSIKDNEVIAAADEYGLAMVFTGIRHFLH